MNRWTISVARRGSVATMDRHIGPKRVAIIPRPWMRQGAWRSFGSCARSRAGSPAPTPSGGRRTGSPSACATLGRRAEVEPTYVHPQSALVHAAHCLIAFAGSLVAISSPAVGFALVLFAATSMYLDLNYRLYLLRSLFFRRGSQNVVSPGPNPGARARLVICAHMDAARSGAIYAPRRARRRGPALRSARRCRSAPTGSSSGRWRCCCRCSAREWPGSTPTRSRCSSSSPRSSCSSPSSRWSRSSSPRSSRARTTTPRGSRRRSRSPAELDADPPANLDVWVVLDGGEECQQEGMRRFVRAHRKEFDRATHLLPRHRVGRRRRRALRDQRRLGRELRDGSPPDRALHGDRRRPSRRFKARAARQRDRRRLDAATARAPALDRHHLPRRRRDRAEPPPADRHAGCDRPRRRWSARTPSRSSSSAASTPTSGARRRRGDRSPRVSETSPATPGELLWTPSPEVVERSNLTAYVAPARVRARAGLRRRLHGHVALVGRRARGLLGDDLGAVRGPRLGPYARVLGDRDDARARSGSRARNSTTPRTCSPAGPTTASRSSTPRSCASSRSLTWGELRAEVARVAAALRALGVEPGDRVVAYLPNIAEAVIAFLATASIGAIWSSCSPDFGASSVVDRFAQIEPKVLFCVDGYRYNGRDFDRRDVVAGLLAEMPTVEHAIVVPYLDPEPDLGPLRDAVALGRRCSARRPAAELAFEQVPFDHPLWVLYSSGTTGLPKAIVQGHGGILLEQLKSHHLHVDAQEGDRIFWFTTTGWMMWNFLVGVLLTDASIVLYDGSPGHPDMDVLWDLAGGRRRHLLRHLGQLRRRLHEGGGRAGRRARPERPALGRLHRLAAGARGLRLDLRARRRRHVAVLHLRRHGRLHRLRRRRPHPAGLRRRAAGPLAGRRDRGLGRGRQGGRRRGRRAGDHRADAVDAGLLLGRRGRLALPRLLLRDLPGGMETRRLDRDHRARHGDHLRALGLDHQPLGRAHGDVGDLPRGRRASTRSSTRSSWTSPAGHRGLDAAVRRARRGRRRSTTS